MSLQLTCRHGHRWESGELEGGVATLVDRICPVCGAEAVGQSDPTNLVTVTPQNGLPLPTEFPEIPGYEIISVLGRGGMGVVYKARQTGLKRFVALKMILAGAHAGPNELQRFKAEAEAVAQLQHPNIVQIYDIQEWQGQPFFSLEYVDGGSLSQYSRGKPLAARQAAHFIEALASAVHYAHQRGIVHRDLKPANILLSTGAAGATGSSVNLDDTEQDALRAERYVPASFPTDSLIPKITDFGLAKRLTEGGKNITRTGYAMGTPHYMAPEQALGNAKDVGPCTDIYSLGVILYEMLTGRVPFQAENPLDLMSQVVRDEPPSPFQLQPHLPGDLVTICLKCLRKDPGQRYETAAALAEDAKRFLNGMPILARPLNSWDRALRALRQQPMLMLVVLVLVASAIVLLTVNNAPEQILVPVACVTLFGLLWQWQRAERQRCRAEEQRLQGDEARREAEEHRLLAENSRRDAVAQAQKAARALREAEAHLYSHRIALAERDWQASNVQRVEEILGTCPVHLRSWEWHFLKRLLHTELLTFTGHNDWVRSIAFNPASGQIASAGGFDETTKIWEPLTGREILKLTGQMDCVRAVAYSSDGRWLATAGDDQLVRIHDAASGSCTGILRGHQEAVLNVHFSPDGEHLVSTSTDCTLRLWSRADAKEIGIIRSQKDTINDAAFSPDGKFIAAAGKDRTVRIYDALTGRETLVLQGHTDAVASVVYSPDGQRLATAGSNDATGKLWDAVTGQELSTLRGHAEAVWQVAFHPDGRHLATAGGDGTIKVWDIASGKPLFQLRGHIKAVTGVAFSPDGNQLASASTDGTVKIWNALAPQDAVPFGTHEGVECLAIRGDSGMLVTGSSTGTIRLWDVAARTMVAELEGHEGCVISLNFSPDGRRLASGGSDGRVTLWDPIAQDVAVSFEGHVRPVSAVTFGPDNRLLASASLDGTVKLWDVHDGKSKLTYRGHIGQVTSLAFHPHGRMMASSSVDPLRGHLEIKLWNPDNAEEIRTFLISRLEVESAIVCFGPSGRRLATCSHGHTAKIWDARTGHELCTLNGHTKPIISMAFSPDGQRIVTASQDQTMKVWDSLTGHEVLTLRGHAFDVIQAQFSPSGRQLITVHRDGTVRFW